MARLSVPIGLDAFVDERGAMVVGRSIQTGRTFDQGACVAMWGEALVFPGVVARPRRRRLGAFRRANARGSSSPVRMERSRSSCRSTARTGLPTICAAGRYKGLGPMTRWYGAWSEWVVGPEGVLAPRADEGSLG